MILPSFLPPYQFERTELPPLPGVSSDHEILRCAQTGVMGHRPKGGMFVTILSRSNAVNIVREFDQPGEYKWFAKITCPRLSKRGPAFGHLIQNSTHLIVSPPPEDTGNAPGVWVAGGVMLGPKDFQPELMRVRSRKRAASL